MTRSKSLLGLLRYIAGVIDVEFTYQQFLRRVKDVSNDKGDPPTSREHQNPAPPIVVANHTSQPGPIPDNGNGNREAPAPHAHQDPTQKSEENSEVAAELSKLSIQALKDRCKERGEKIGGKKSDLVFRLLKPRKPEILLMRMRRNEYVPKVPSSNAAVSLQLDSIHHFQ